MTFTPISSPSLHSGLYPQRLIKPKAPGALNTIGQYLGALLRKRKFRLSKQRYNVQNIRKQQELMSPVQRALSAWEEHRGTPCRDSIVAGALALLHDRSLVELNDYTDCEEAACIAALAQGLSGISVHMIYAQTPNGPEQLFAVAQKLGLKLGILQDEQTLEQRRAAYGANITLVSFRQLMFDYLLDESLFAKQKSKLGGRLEQRLLAPNVPLLRGLACGIVVDARTVLIAHADRPIAISAGENTSESDVSVFYQEAINLARLLHLQSDYLWNDTSNVPVLLETGIQKLQDLSRELGPLWRGTLRANNAACAALTALRMVEGADYKIIAGQLSFDDCPPLNKTLSSISKAGWKQLLHAKHDLQNEAERPKISHRLSLQQFFPRYLHFSAAGYLFQPRRRELEQVYGFLSVPVYIKQKRNRPKLRLFKKTSERFTTVSTLMQKNIVNQENILMVSRDQETKKALHATLDKKVLGVLHTGENLGEQAEISGLFFSVTIKEALEQIEKIGALGEFRNVFFVDTPSGMLEEYLICSSLISQGEILLLASADEVLFDFCSWPLRSLIPYSKFTYSLIRNRLELKERQGRIQVAEYDAYVRQSLAFRGSLH